MDSVKRTDVQDLTVEVRGLRKAVRTGRNNQRVIAIVLGLSLLVTAGLGYVYVSDRDQDERAKDLARCVADSNSRQDALLSELLESNKDHRQAQRDLLSGPRTSDPVEIQERLDRYGESLGQNDAAADRLIAELGKNDDC